MNKIDDKGHRYNGVSLTELAYGGSRLFGIMGIFMFLLSSLFTIFALVTGLFISNGEPFGWATLGVSAIVLVVSFIAGGVIALLISLAIHFYARVSCRVRAIDYGKSSWNGQENPGVSNVLFTVLVGYFALFIFVGHYMTSRLPNFI